ncbi:hypothetical protein [Aureimonas glaciei]|uniref:Uncharacterized protein n=1 Tax=Aureimonas glaciei TaxID=1776957 RepID=A0A917DJC1_9HYPH|nr:hypothetical protein [Aureimonas glaciei]GGD43171.1 hypothetical protein GCM10011335_52320 [Aureimonas glaciei]
MSATDHRVIGRQVDAPFPAEIRAVFTTKDGRVRYVVEGDDGEVGHHEDLWVFSGEQIGMPGEAPL